MMSSKFIEKTIKKWKIRLFIKKSVFWTTDFKTWRQLGGINVGFNSSQIWGSIHTPQNIIFINIKKNSTQEELEDTIIHELLHAKYPKLSEKKLRAKIEKLVTAK